MSNNRNTLEAAGFVGVSPRTLEKWRIGGDGPPYLKLGTRVVYSEEDLVRWLDTHRLRSTSEAQLREGKQCMQVPYPHLEQRYLSRNVGPSHDAQPGDRSLR
jgi:hypothetical protein